VNTDRRYLEIPPGDEAEAEALGARWEEESRRWFIAPGKDPEGFARWLPKDETDEEEFTVMSDEAYVASARVSCQECGEQIEVICIHCATGKVRGEPLTQFTVSSITAMDAALATELSEWPTFREVSGESDDSRYYANHCPHCGAVQEDMYLHSEPEQAFFCIPREAEGRVRLTRIAGEVCLSGDENFEV
jgi:hypothetical protein